MKKLQFGSVFAENIKSFLAHKRALGYAYQSEEWHLHHFDKLCNELGIKEPMITKELADSFAAIKPTEGAKTRYNRICILRQFARYMSKCGLSAYVIPEIKKPFIAQNYVPYIFCKSEIDEILCAASTMSYIRFSKYAKYVLPMVFRVLYRCGLRTSEVRNLKRADVDFANGILCILEAKNAKDRLVPMSEDLTVEMRQYYAKISAISPDSVWLFPHYDDGKLTEHIIYEWFRKLLPHTSIVHHGKGKGPRVHDFRHTFAIHSLRKMEREGLDLYTSLPTLSAYLGHDNIAATEQYLRMTAQVHGEILKQVENAHGQIVSPVVKEREA